ncbi:MAG: hypothetical protein U5L09_00180 [Bacteroidales bacterium]|nr:hypothetical protein [Bacteroidales bacterium]
MGRALDVMTRNSSRHTGTLLEAKEGEGITLEIKDFSTRKKKKSQRSRRLFIAFDEITIAKAW